MRRAVAGGLRDGRRTEDGLDGLRVGDGGEPLGSVLLDVIVEDAAVNHELNYYHNNRKNINGIGKRKEKKRGGEGGYWVYVLLGNI